MTKILKAKKYSKTHLSIIIILILLMIIQELVSINQSSLTGDERCYVGAGKTILETGNMRNNALVYHPPLSYYIGSILLLPLKFDKRIFQSNDCWQIGENVVFHSGYKPNKIIFLSRLPFVFLSVILALYVLKWATELYGIKSGLVALFLYSFNPSIIAYSGLVLTDFIVAMMFFIAVYYFWKLIKEPSKKHLILSGIFLGLALLSKITAILLIPLFLILGVIAVYQKKYSINIKTLVKNLLVIFFISFILIFTFYGFQFDTVGNSLYFDTPISLPSKFYYNMARLELSKSPFFSKQLIYMYDNVPIPMPTYWIGFGKQFYASTQHKQTYIFGKVVDNVVWYMVYVTFLVKTGITILLFLIFLFILRKNLPKKDLFTNLCLWLPIILIFMNFSITNKMSGVKHILSIYPFIFVLSGNVVNAKVNKQKLYNIMLIFLLFYYALSTFFIAPYYLSYISGLVGGPNNVHKIVVGPNIDIGQDLYGLKGYMDKNNIQKIKLSYFGSVEPKDYNISYDYLPSAFYQPWVPDYTLLELDKRKEDCSEKKGIIAISITNLKNSQLINKTCFDWLKKYEPIDKIGYTIFVYNIK